MRYFLAPLPTGERIKVRGLLVFQRPLKICGRSSVGRTFACQAKGRGFEAHRPLFVFSCGAVPKWLRERSANGSNESHFSIIFNNGIGSN